MLQVNNPNRSRVQVNSATIDITVDRDVKRGETLTLTLSNFGVGLTVTGRGEGIEEEQEQDYPTVLSPPLFSDDGEDGKGETEQEQVVEVQVYQNEKMDPATGEEGEEKGWQFTLLCRLSVTQFNHKERCLSPPSYRRYSGHSGESQIFLYFRLICWLLADPA